MMNDDLDKQRRVIVNLQSSLSAKEVDLREQNQRLTVTSQLCDAQATELGNLQRLLSRMVQEIKHQQLNDIPQQQVMGERRVISTSSHENIALGSYPSDVSKGTCRWEEENALRMNGKKCNLKSLDYRRMLDKHCNPDWDALDSAEERIKSRLIIELFDAIPETITHKYACHVWQKVCAIQWTDESPQVMAHVHAELQGQWARVALDENGSLVIQNIFENLTEAEKKPVLEEVLADIVMIAKGQWGNWVVQHILEQADNNTDRQRAFQIVLNECIQLSMDQFASKVVEKALRIGGRMFLSQFIDQITTTSRSHRPRIALVDIASDQYGNYVVQWLLNNADDNQKICMSRLIKKHMVSLRGSKYGQRVAFLVEKVLRNLEVTTYPATPNTLL
ncbi:hypothetical protein DFQ28_004587 [Apophysomyces sp. BC1034]|nr:hypothetical protein DFQ29_004013 [Apophysomyces sp. BC1021]KAG0188623.1 hypothetical protein DFQ28_004587 [Apophysomyces sp. BC1034]